MRGERVKDYLDSNKIRYVTITHSPAYTAQGIAHSAHIPGKEVAKTVIVKVDGRLSMVVLPANQKVNLDALRKALNAREADLAGEDDFKDMFPDCETGAMPPFGNLYDVEVHVAEALARDKEIAFNAGTHTELIRMDYSDFERLVKPKKIAL
jgi:Ala-tRNA(Pro) deacylase